MTVHGGAWSWPLSDIPCASGHLCIADHKMGMCTSVRDMRTGCFFKDRCFRLNWGSLGFKTILAGFGRAPARSAWLSRRALRTLSGRQDLAGMVGGRCVAGKSSCR